MSRLPFLSAPTDIELDVILPECFGTGQDDHLYALTQIPGCPQGSRVRRGSKTFLPDEVPVSPLLKKINHFLEDNNKIYISCDFGISIYNLATMEFGETYYMGPQGSYVAVQQTAINNGVIYAATKGNPFGSGIRKANLSNPFLDDFNQWVDISGNEWNGVTSFGTHIFAITSAVNLVKYDGTNLTYLLSYPESLIDIRSNSNYLTVTSANHVYIYNPSMQLVAHIQSNQVSGAFG